MIRFRSNATPRVLAVASGGGHWVQMMRLRPAFASCDVAFATTPHAAISMVNPSRLHTYADANAQTPAALIMAAFKLLWIVLRERPDVIVSTGAAGGVLAILFGRLVGAPGLFIDSIANAETLSLSARLLRRVSAVASQWPDVARRNGVLHFGSVI